MPDVFIAGHPHRSAVEYSTVMAKEKRTTNPLSAFIVRPKKLHFETQDKHEHLLLLLRAHLVTNVAWILISLLGLLVPIVVSMLPGWQLVPNNFQVVGVVVWYLLVSGYVLERFLSWYFNVFIVTDERIIDIDFYSLLYKKFSSAKIQQIEDLTFTQGGILAAFFNYGDIFIQTAGERREFDVMRVPQPRKVVLFINEMIVEEERERHEGRVR